MVNELLVNLVNRALGAGKRTARGNQAYTCAFSALVFPQSVYSFYPLEEAASRKSD